MGGPVRTNSDGRQYHLHLKRLQDGRAAIKRLRPATSLAPAFKHWRERTERSLLELFDEDHPYYDDFSTLSFSDGWPDEPDDWTLEDQETFEHDLNEAERILGDAIEEAEHLMPGANVARTASGAEAIPRATSGEQKRAMSAVHVNVYNVLSQMTIVSTAQIVASLHELDLSPSDRTAAEKLVEEFEREAEGKQRWSKLGKTVDRLKDLGASIYEKVAVPLLLEYLKRQVGLGGR